MNKILAAILRKAAAVAVPVAESKIDNYLHPADSAKREFARAVENLPDEAFGWMVSAALTDYPDGLGGFRPESRVAIEQLRRAAHNYIQKQR